MWRARSRRPEGAGKVAPRFWIYALAALAGNLLLHQLPALPGAAACATIAVGALGAWLTVPRNVFGWIAVAALAFVWTAQRAQSVLDRRWPESANGTDIAVTGWIDEFPSVQPGRTVFSLRVESAATEVPIERLRLSWYDAPEGVLPGAALTLRVRLRAPRGLVNPAGFDYERWLFLERYSATGYVRSGAVDRERQPGFARRWLKLRAGIARRLEQGIVTPDAAALVAALSLGERSGFEDRHWSVMQRTGTSHLVAVSGLHIGLIALFSFLLVLRVALCLPYAVARRAYLLAAGFSLLFAAAYAAMAGFALPTQRALAMLVVAQTLIVSGRRWPVANGLSIALIAVLALDPLATLTPSFWLSFGAVSVLLISLRQPVHAPDPSADVGRGGTGEGQARSDRSPLAVLRARWRRRLLAFARLQIALTLALMPLVIWFFGQMSFASVAVNLVAIPLFSLVVVPLSLLAAGSAAFDAGGFGIVWLAGVSAESVWRLLELAASSDWAAVELPRPSVWALATSLAGLVLSLPRMPLPGRRLAVVAMAPLFVARGSAIEQGQARVTVLDVGQGLAVAVETAGHRLLYDAGPVYRSGFDAGAEIVAPVLAALGSDPLDLLILSHGDSDHAGGAAAVRARYPSVPVLAGPDIPERIPWLGSAEPCRAGQSWRWDGVRFSILHPPDRFFPLGNESSCVLSVATREAVVLLTGDIESRAESGLVARSRLAADVVVVPHHGSATSSTRAFVDEVAAAFAVVSAGHDNQWNFPRQEVRERWAASGAEMLVTGNAGAVTIRLDRDGAHLETERARRRRYWQANVTPVPGAVGAAAL